MIDRGKFKEILPSLSAAEIMAACKESFEAFLIIFCHAELWGELGELHKIFIDDVEFVKNNRNRTNLLNYLCHRGSAKTTISILYACYQILFRRENYIIYGSNTYSLCTSFLDRVRNVLSNPSIQSFFSPRIQKSNSIEILCNDILVQALSISQNWRGLYNSQGVRPTLILLDDIQSEEMVGSALQREKTYKHFSDQIMECLPPGEYPTQATIILTNTTLHPDAIAVKIKKERLDFKTTESPAIISEPIREDLWLQFDDLYRDRAEHTVIQAEARAISFHKSNKKLMDDGMKITWAAGKSYPEFRIKRLVAGKRTFNKEYQCNPVDVDILKFGVYLQDENQNRDKNVIFEINNKTILYKNIEFDMNTMALCGHLDGAHGEKAGCFAAFTIAAHHYRKNDRGLDFILDCLLMKEPPEQQCRNILLKSYQWNLQSITVESTAFTIMYKSLLINELKLLKESGIIPEGWTIALYMMPAIASLGGVPKKDIIEAMIIGQGLGHGTLKFNSDPACLTREFWDQIDMFPTHKYCDAPDSLASLLYYIHCIESVKLVKHILG